MNAVHRTTGEKLFDAANVVLLLLLAFVTLYPFYNILITSFNDPADAARGALRSGREYFPLKITRWCFRMKA